MQKAIGKNAIPKGNCGGPKKNTLSNHKSKCIYRVIKKMKDSSIPQVPVFDDKNQIIEIINNNTISRWLSEHADDEGNFLIENEMVKDLIPEIEFRHNYKFISRDKSVYDARDLFFDHINTNKNYLDAIFITHSGKTDEKLLGLITIEDISNLE